MGSPTNGFAEAIGDDDASLRAFITKMAEFDKKFCEMMARGVDFTIRLEVNGSQGSIKHVRLFTDDIEKPFQSVPRRR